MERMSKIKSITSQNGILCQCSQCMSVTLKNLKNVDLLRLNGRKVGDSFCLFPEYVSSLDIFDMQVLQAGFTVNCLRFSSDASVVSRKNVILCIDQRFRTLYWFHPNWKHSKKNSQSDKSAIALAPTHISIPGHLLLMKKTSNIPYFVNEDDFEGFVNLDLITEIEARQVKNDDFIAAVISSDPKKKFSSASNMILYLKFSFSVTSSKVVQFLVTDYGFNIWTKALTQVNNGFVCFKMSFEG